MILRSRIVGVGAYLPTNIVTNHQLVAEGVDTSNEWIVQRSGITQRHRAAEGELTSDLAYAAASRALTASGISVQELDAIVLGTTTPDETFPATATKVQAMLGMQRGFAFDVQAVCSGFIYGLSIADSLLKSGQARTALVIGAETFTRLLDMNDRSTCVLFGDGAGAVLLRAEPALGDVSDRGVLSTHLHSDGREYRRLYVDGGPSSTQTTGFVHMDGREVFRHAVTRLAEAAEQALDAHGLTAADVDWLVPHQANLRIIESTGKKLGIPSNKVVVTVDRHANTSAASIPLALEAAVSDGRIKTGDLLIMEAMGGGFTWGSALVRF
jgi:3-oxoacyl-[acyl-carrier-protein] synthase-3